MTHLTHLLRTETLPFLYRRIRYRFNGKIYRTEKGFLNALSRFSHDEKLGTLVDVWLEDVFHDEKFDTCSLSYVLAYQGLDDFEREINTIIRFVVIDTCEVVNPDDWEVLMS